jgi:glutamate dehydrogenase (NAD(P)+)
MPTDTLQLIDEWGPEKVVCVSDRKSGMRGVLAIDNSARGVGKGGTRMSPRAAQELAQQRVRTAMMLRGQIPAGAR